MASINGGLILTKSFKKIFPFDLEPKIFFRQAKMTSTQKSPTKTVQGGEKVVHLNIPLFWCFFCVDFYDFHEALGVFSPEKANIQ